MAKRRRQRGAQRPRRPDGQIRQSQMVTTFGKQLLRFPALLKPLSWAALIAEVLFPVLLFVPKYTVVLRVVSIASLCCPALLKCRAREWRTFR